MADGESVVDPPARRAVELPLPGPRAGLGAERARPPGRIGIWTGLDDMAHTAGALLVSRTDQTVDGPGARPGPLVRSRRLPPRPPAPPRSGLRGGGRPPPPGPSPAVRATGRRRQLSGKQPRRSTAGSARQVLVVKIDPSRLDMSGLQPRRPEPQPQDRRNPDVGPASFTNLMQSHLPPRCHRVYQRFPRIYLKRHACYQYR